MRRPSPATVRWLILLAVIGLAVIIWVTSFEWIERLFGYGGLCMLVFAVAAVKSGPDWTKVGNGFVPHLTQGNQVLYLYFGRGGLSPVSEFESVPFLSSPIAFASARATLRASSCTALSLSSASWLVAYGS